MEKREATTGVLKLIRKRWKAFIEGIPSDREGAAFYALSLLASEPDGDTTFSNRKKAAAVLERLFDRNLTIPAWRTT